MSLGRAGLLLVVLASAWPCRATEPPLLPVVEATLPRATHCVDVEVEGRRVRDYDCLSMHLAAVDDPVTRPRWQAGSAEIAGRPPSALGLAHPAATRQRMGNTFGLSTQPQRPPPTLPPPAFGRPLPPAR